MLGVAYGGISRHCRLYAMTCLPVCLCRACACIAVLFTARTLTAAGNTPVDYVSLLSQYHERKVVLAECSWSITSSLWSLRLWARNCTIIAKAAVCDRRNGCRSTTRPSYRPGTDDDRPGFERRRRIAERRRRVRTPKRPVQNHLTVRNDVAVPSNVVAARPVRRHRRWAVGAATGTTRRQTSHRRRRGIILHRFATRFAAPAAPLLSDCFIFLLCSPLSVATPFRYSALVLAVSPYS